MRETVAPRIWVELEDLIRYFDYRATPTGIGRVQLEIVPALLRLFPEQVGIIRLGNDPDDVRVIPPGQFTAMIGIGPAAARRQNSAFPDWLMTAARFCRRKGLGFFERWFQAPRQRRDFREMVKPGDIVLALGAGWTHPNFGRSLRALKARHGVRFALLIHDILPVSHPDYVSSSHTPTFVRWLEDMRITWDMVLTPSISSAEALRDYLVAADQPVPPITPIPFGFGFSGAVEAKPGERIEAAPYVLFVSTIEVRKNHLLLYRIWERLIAKHGAASVPKLVFAGKRGWDIETLKARMAESRGLDGKIVIMSNLSDAQVSRAYDDCLFTVFPSFCEGWGLPVSEGLFHGRLCIASNATSIPEIGGAAVDYFDPFDEEAAYKAIERALFEPGYVEAREAWIRDNFVLPTWDGTAQALMRILVEREDPPQAASRGLAEAPVGT